MLPVGTMQDARPSGHVGDWVPAGCTVHKVGGDIAAAMTERSGGAWEILVSKSATSAMVGYGSDSSTMPSLQYHL